MKGGCTSPQKDQRDSGGKGGIGLRNTFLLRPRDLLLTNRKSTIPLRGALSRRGTWNKFLSALPEMGAKGIEQDCRYWTQKHVPCSSTRWAQS